MMYGPSELKQLSEWHVKNWQHDMGSAWCKFAILFIENRGRIFRPIVYHLCRPSGWTEENPDPAPYGAPIIMPVDPVDRRRPSGRTPV